ncbi:uncharacterized protein DS421_17g590920 [Arachis hypogaea]|nr:uncharacterized protein DS421_17g590920 [Arachis hypogaea]
MRSCAYACLLVRTHTLLCVLFLVFFFMFSPLYMLSSTSGYAFLPLRPENTQQTCHSIKWNKSGIKLLISSTKLHVFTFKIKLGTKHKNILFLCLSVSSCARIHLN